MTKHEYQLHLEQEAYDNSYKRFLDDLTRKIQAGETHELPEGKVLLKATIEKVAEKLDEYFTTTQQRDNKVAQIALLDYIDNTLELAYLAVSTLISILGTHGLSTTAFICKEISNTIYRDSLIREAKTNEPKLIKYIERTNKKKGKSRLIREKVKLGRLITKQKKELKGSMLSPIGTKVGGVLLECIVASGANLVYGVRVKDPKKAHAHKEWRFTDEAFKLILSLRETTHMSFQIYPIFVIPPVDWSGLEGSGGYYNSKLYKEELIKLGWGDKEIFSTISTYLKAKPIDRYIEQVNRIQATKWRVNKRVYEVINTVMEENLVDYDTPKVNPRLLGGLPYNRQQLPEEYVIAEEYNKEDPQGRKDWAKATEDMKLKIETTRSKAMAMNRAMMEAKKYLNEEAIYFSYQADRRGRIYPLQQNLQPQQKSEIKALLEFGNGAKITTPEQLRWFKIYGANCYGDDKSLYEHRVATVDSITEDIKLIASDPLVYNHLWKDTDEPYLFLAWCFEYADYLADNENFVSHIPIALDATCSGIQVYSGLLLDREGALAVNVIGQTRNDIYQQVADKANGYLNAGDYRKEVKHKHSDGSIVMTSTVAEANKIKGNINRKLTKSNTMTVPYSVTGFGMMEQLREILDKMEEEGKKFWIADKFIVRSLIKDANEKAIYDTVKAARIGQDFIKKVTNEVIKGDTDLFFTSPIFGFPVYLEVQKKKTKTVHTELGDIKILQWDEGKDGSKMKAGIAPNFIHMLDSTLMMLTLEKMKDCKSFHMIHDSYGFPIDHVEDFNTQVREAFIEIFEARPLERFTRQLCPRMEEEAKAVMVNTLDINEVRESEYIFS